MEDMGTGGGLSNFAFLRILFVTIIAIAIIAIAIIAIATNITIITNIFALLMLAVTS